MTHLCSTALVFGTDKYPWYTPFYDMLLFDRRYAVRKVLELGIGSPSAMAHVVGYKPGASLRMWAEYFPAAHIYGVDNDPSTMLDALHISTRLCDQTNLAALVQLAQDCGPFDLIVDDGSHIATHQLIALTALFPYVAPGGLYIVEDADPLLVPPMPYSRVECHVPHSELVGHCVVLHG